MTEQTKSQSIHTEYSHMPLPLNVSAKVGELEYSLSDDFHTICQVAGGVGIGFLNGTYASIAGRTWAKTLGNDYGFDSETGKLAAFAAQGLTGLAMILLATPIGLNELYKHGGWKQATCAAGALVLTNALSYYASRKKPDEIKQTKV